VGTPAVNKNGSQRCGPFLFCGAASVHPHGRSLTDLSLSNAAVPWPR